jgi:uncharacterized protein (DUF4415 family)
MKTAEQTEALLIKGILYIRQPDGSLRPNGGKTDWARLKAMPDDRIEAEAQADTDNPPMSDEAWTKAISVPSKRYIHLGVDEDVLSWFKDHGRGYQTRINAVLRRYVEAQRKAG